MPDGSDAYSLYLKEKYKKSNGKEIELHLLKDGVNKLLRHDEKRTRNRKEVDRTGNTTSYGRI